MGLRVGTVLGSRSRDCERDLLVLIWKRKLERSSLQPPDASTEIYTEVLLVDTC